MGLEGDEPLKGSRSTHAAGTSPFSLHKAVIVGEISCSCLWVGVVQPETGRRQRWSSRFFLPVSLSLGPFISAIYQRNHNRRLSSARDLLKLGQCNLIFSFFKHFDWIESFEFEPIVLCWFTKVSAVWWHGWSLLWWIWVTLCWVVVIFRVIYSPFAEGLFTPK